MKHTHLIVLICVCFFSCKKNKTVSCNDANPLHEEAEFKIGAAIDLSSYYASIAYRNTADRQFNSFTAENAFKPNALHPDLNHFEFALADSFSLACARGDKRLHGHTLLWHSALPNWILNYQGNEKEWQNLFKQHIQTIVSHFKGRVKAWDVVNEAFNEDGTLRKSIWLEKLGTAYIEKAFEYAHEADADALLFYNDYGLEFNPEKRVAVLSYLNNMRSRGVQVDGIGLQLHISLSYPDISQINEALQEISAYHYQVHLSEVDISINPLNQTNLNKEKLFEQQAQLAAKLVLAYKQLPNDQQYGITFWGFSDAYSWIPTYYGREDYPLLYTGDFQPKPMYCKLKETL